MTQIITQQICASNLLRYPCMTVAKLCARKDSVFAALENTGVHNVLSKLHVKVVEKQHIILSAECLSAIILLTVTFKSESIVKRIALGNVTATQTNFEPFDPLC